MSPKEPSVRAGLCTGMLFFEEGGGGGGGGGRYIGSWKSLLDFFKFNGYVIQKNILKR